MSTEVVQARIVLVTGDEDMASLIRTILASDGLDVQSAPNGRTGLALARGQAPDLLLLDLNLPDMNGWEFFMQLQPDAGGARPPVIILANQASRVDRTFGLRVAQVHDYLVKPFLPSQLRASVSQAIQPRPAPRYRYNISQHLA